MKRDSLKEPERIIKKSKTALIFILCAFFQKSVSLIMVPVFSRLMAVDEYGKYSVFNSWLDILSVFVTLRLCLGVFPQGIVKYERDRESFENSIRSLHFLLVLFWFFVFFICSHISLKMLNMSFFELTMMFMLMLTSSFIEFWLAEKRYELDYKAVLKFTLLITLLRPLVCVTFVLNERGKADARIFGNVFVELVCCAILLVFYHKNHKLEFNRKYWKYALGFNLPLVPHYLSQTVLNGADRLMIDKMVGVKEAGIYSVAYTLSLVLLVINHALMSYLSPWIYKKIKRNEIERIQKVADAAVIIVAIPNLMLIAYAPEIIHIFLPSAYYDTIFIMPPIIMSVFFLFCYELVVRFEFYYEKKIYITFASVFCAFINILLNYIFIPKFGYSAAAYTTLVSYILYAFSHYRFVKTIENRLSASRIILASVVFCGIGLALFLGYKNSAIKNCMVMAIVVWLIIMRNKLKKSIVEILNMN